MGKLIVGEGILRSESEQQLICGSVKNVVFMEWDIESTTKEGRLHIQGSVPEFYLTLHMIKKDEAEVIMRAIAKRAWGREDAVNKEEFEVDTG